MNWQVVLTSLLVGLSAAHVVRHAWRSLRGSRGDCAGCSRCTSSRSKLVELDLSVAGSEQFGDAGHLLHKPEPVQDPHISAAD